MIAVEVVQGRLKRVLTRSRSSSSNLELHATLRCSVRRLVHLHNEPIMSVESQSLEIAPLKSPLPTCTPNLMPFHIAYSGPAPISTYLRVRSAPPPTYGKDDPQASRYFATSSTGIAEATAASASQSTLVASSSGVTLDAEGTLVETQSTTLVTNSPSAPLVSGDAILEASEPKHESPLAAPVAERWVSAFRGRSIQGLTVPLPEGYAGIVLRAPQDGAFGAAAADRAEERAREREKARAKAKKESKRGTRRSARIIDVDDDVVDVDASEQVAEHVGVAAEGELEDPVRTLTATSTFSQFVLWNPDFPVDEGKDEYLRSLAEWTKLAAEVSTCEIFSDSRSLSDARLKIHRVDL